MTSEQRARAMRAVFGRARDLGRVSASPAEPDERAIVKLMPSLGFCSSDISFIPVRMPRIKTLHGEFRR